MSFRNESPPHDLDESIRAQDKIGNSCYSELWLYKLLMNLLRYVSENKPDKSPDIDKDIEDNLCILWDITVDKSILGDLIKFDLIEIFAKVLVQNEFPRITEIIFGILANLAYNEELCKGISENDYLIEFILASLNYRDIPILNEACRLIQTVIASDHRSNWTEKIHFQESLLENLIFFLTNSLNITLLNNCLHLIEALITEDDSIAEIWCDNNLLDAFFEAHTQVKGSSETYDPEIFLRILYTYSATVNGLKAMLNVKDKIIQLILDDLQIIMDDEMEKDCYLDQKYYNPMRALVPVIDVLIASSEPKDSLDILNKKSKGGCDKKLINYLLDVGILCKHQMGNISQSEDSSDLQMRDIIHGIWSDLRTLFKDSLQAIEELLKTDNKEDSSLNWIKDLNSDQTLIGEEYRTIFVECLLGKDSSSLKRKGLFDICRSIGLERFLEGLTDE